MSRIVHSHHEKLGSDFVIMPSAPPLEPICPYEIEPLLREPAPRRVRVSPVVGVLLFCVALFWLAGAALALAALTEFTKLTWLCCAGHSATAHVREVIFEDGRRGAASLESLPRIEGVVYVYKTEGGRERSGTVAASLPERKHGFSTFAPTPVVTALQARQLTAMQRLVLSGRPWRVRYAPWFGGTISEVWPRVPSGKMLFLLTVGLFVSGCAAFFALRVSRWFKTRVLLLRLGTATVGTILHTRTDAVDTPKFFVRYGYAVAGAAHEREEQCGAEQWRRFHVGESVTVLCAPNDPNMAALYRLLPFGQ